MNKQPLHLFTLLILTILIPHSFALYGRCEPESSCDCDNTGKTYFSVRPQFQTASPELVSAFWEDRLHARENGREGALELVLFGGQSTHNTNLQRYFTPFCKTRLTASGLLDKDTIIDLYAPQFNVLTNEDTFESTVQFNPKQSTIALGFYYRQSFWHHEKSGRDWFFSISSPLTHLTNTFTITENIIDDGGGIDKEINPQAVATMTEAFEQEAWHYGRIESSRVRPSSCSSCPMTKTRFADIELKLGVEWVNTDTCHLESYTGILVPTGNKPTGVRIFEPIVGNGGHPGLMFGSIGSYELWHNDQNSRWIKAECAMHSLYLFNSRQVRSIDLKDKPFSRYMELYANEEQATQAAALLAQSLEHPDPNSLEARALAAQARNLSTPGINLLTLPVNVTSGFQFNFTTALTLTCESGFKLEGGYNFFARAPECVKLACPWKTGPAIKSITGRGHTNPVRDITGNIFLNRINTDLNELSAYEDNMIQQSDLDLNSAAHPAGLSYTLYGSLGYRCDEREYPLMAHIGGSYEFANESNATLDRWTIWAKAGISF